MKMFSFKNYESEIRKVSRELNVDIGVAYDKFRADVRLGTAHKDNTGTALPNFDFASAKSEWDKLTEKEKEACYDEWHR